MIRRSKKARQRARMVKGLDAVARQQVFERDGHKCVRCGSTRNLQWCHVFSRRHKNLRWEPDNAFTGCAGCHMFWHGNPVMAVDWFRKNWPERYEHIVAMFNAGGKVNIKERYENL